MGASRRTAIARRAVGARAGEGADKTRYIDLANFVVVEVGNQPVVGIVDNDELGRAELGASRRPPVAGRA